MRGTCCDFKKIKSEENKKNTDIENSKYPSHPFSEKGCAIIHPKKSTVLFDDNVNEAKLVIMS